MPRLGECLKILGDQRNSTQLKEYVTTRKGLTIGAHDLKKEKIDRI